MRAIAAQQPFEVLQQYAQAHIVRLDRTTGYALFEAQDKLDMGVLMGLDAPCLVLITEDKNRIVRSLCDPDLRLMEDPVPDAGHIRGKMWFNESVMKTVNVRLKGAWQLAKSYDDVRLVAGADGETALAFDCVDGLTREVELRKA